MDQRVRPAVTKREVDEFLACRRVAVIGASRHPRSFSRSVVRALVRRGCDVVPVNPHGEEIEGRRCFHSVEQIDPPVEAAIVLTPRRVAAQVADSCLAAAVPRVWFALTTDTAEAVERCRSGGIAVIAGRCPLMFLPGAGWIHRLHGFIDQLIGRYPR